MSEPNTENSEDNNLIVNAPNTQIHDRSLLWLGTCTSIKSHEVKLVK